MANGLIGDTNNYSVAKSLNSLLKTEIPRYPYSRFLFPHKSVKMRMVYLLHVSPLLTLGPHPYQYQNEDGWYEGVLKGRRGLFPANCVQISGSEDPNITSCILIMQHHSNHINTLYSYNKHINLSQSKGHDALAYSPFSTCEHLSLSTPLSWQPRVGLTQSMTIIMCSVSPSHSIRLQCRLSSCYMLHMT